MTMNPIQQTFTPPGSGTAQRAEALAPQVQAGRAGGGSEAAGSAGASGSSAGDTVSISQAARQLLGSTPTHGAAAGSASSQRLNALRQSIAAGTYVVDPQRIAQGLLRDSQALAGAAAVGGAAGSA